MYKERIESREYMYYQVGDEYLCEVLSNGNVITEFMGYGNSPAPTGMIREMKEFINAEVN